jgi:hypothetical protein
MTIFQRLICTVFVVLACALSLSAQTTEKQADKEIRVCYEGELLKDFTQRGTVRFNFTYLIETDEKGMVEKATKVEPKHQQIGAHEDKIVECLKTWKLASKEKYEVVLSIGTTSAKDYISITDSKNETIKLIL